MMLGQVKTAIISLIMGKGCDYIAKQQKTTSSFVYQNELLGEVNEDGSVETFKLTFVLGTVIK